jgi:hypothetical protein
MGFWTRYPVYNMESVNGELNNYLVNQSEDLIGNDPQAVGTSLHYGKLFFFFKINFIIFSILFVFPSFSER